MSKKCTDCAKREIQLLTLHRVVESFDQKLEACRKKAHEGRAKLHGQDLCVHCLITAYATVTTLGQVLAHPQDPSDERGVWPAIRADVEYSKRWRRILGVSLWIFLVIGVVAAMKLLSMRLS